MKKFSPESNPQGDDSTFNSDTPISQILRSVLEGNSGEHDASFPQERDSTRGLQEASCSGPLKSNDCGRETLTKRSSDGYLRNREREKASELALRCNTPSLEPGPVVVPQGETVISEPSSIESDIEKLGIECRKSPSSTGSVPKEDDNLSHLGPRVSKDAEGNIYPEGGASAWLCVLGSFCGLIAILGVTNTLSVYQNYLITHQLANVNVSTVGWIFGLYTFVAFGGGIQIGPTFDAVGPRWLVFAGSVCTVASTLILGECHSYWQFLLTFGLLGGLGMSLVFTPAIASIGHYFLRRRGEATGIVATGGALGGIVFPLALQALFPKIGFAWTARVIALIQLILLSIANLLIRSRLPRKRPSRENLLPDFRIFKDPVFTLVTAGIFCMEWGLFIPLSYISSYAVANGVDEALAYQLVAIFNVGSLFGRWLPGYLADRIGRFNSMILFIGLCLVSSVALWLPAKGSVPLLVVMCLTFGFASGSNISLTPVCVGQLCKTEHYGRYYASAFTIVSFGCLTGVPIGGQIISACGGAYWGLVTFAGCVYAAALVCFVVARGLGGGWRLKKVF